MEQTDQAISALYPATALPTGASEAADLQALDTGFLTLLPRLGVVREVVERLKLKPARDLGDLLACWADLDTGGPGSPYARRFLNLATLERDAAFVDDGYGRFLVDPAEMLLEHAETLRAAFGVTGDELEIITGRLGFDATTPLTLEAISAIHRRGWLARVLKMSVRELMDLSELTGLDPFALPDPVQPPVVRLIDLVRALRATSLKAAEALYLFWDVDLGGRSAPAERAILAYAQTLRTLLDSIDAQFAVVDDPTGEIARARMALVYGADTTDAFFGLLNGSATVSVAYDHPQPELEAAILAQGTGRLSYDDFRKQLAFAGVMMPETRDDLKAAAGTPPAFDDAIDDLFAAGQALAAPLIARYPELRSLHDTFVTSIESLDARRRTLLTNILPALVSRRRLQHALDSITAEAGVPAAFAATLLQQPTVLHASDDPHAPAVDDLTEIAGHGLAARYFWRQTATGTVDDSADGVPMLAFRATGPVQLPDNGITPGSPISANCWSGYLDAPESGAYGISIEADHGAAITLTVGGQEIVPRPGGSRAHQHRSRSPRRGHAHPGRESTSRGSGTT